MWDACARLASKREFLVQPHCVALIGVRGHLLLRDLGHSFVSMHHRVHVRVVDLVPRGLKAPWWFLFPTVPASSHVLDVFVEACGGRMLTV